MKKSDFRGLVANAIPEINPDQKSLVANFISTIQKAANQRTSEIATNQRTNRLIANSIPMIKRALVANPADNTAASCSTTNPVLVGQSDTRAKNSKSTPLVKNSINFPTTAKNSKSKSLIKNSINFDVSQCPQRAPTTTSQRATCSSLSAVSDHLAALSIREESAATGLSDSILYGGALQNTNQYFVIGTNDAVAVAGWNSTNCKLRFDEYPVITPMFFMDDERNPITMLQCTCSDNLQQRERLNSLDNRLPLSMAIIENEQKLYCLHSSALEFLGLQLYGVVEEENEGVEIEELASGSILLWSVKTASGLYGVVKRSTRGGLSCVTCRKKRCDHLTTFEKERKNFEIEFPRLPSAKEKAPILSKLKVKYRFDLVADFQFPITESELVPSISDIACSHGYSWKGKVASKTCIIYDDRGRPYDGGVVYCKIADGPCGCKQSFDGGERGILNVNNKHLIEYGLLVDYLIRYGRNGQPLVAFYDDLVQSNRQRRLNTISYDVLYRAWSGFSTLVAYDQKSAFCCPKCGEFPNVIVLDGTALSCRKELIPDVIDELSNDLTPLQGTLHKNRVFIFKKKTRDLVHRFATGQIQSTKKEMSQADIRSMLERIGNEFTGSALEQLLIRLSSLGQCIVDKEYRLFLRELSKNTPITGHFQMGSSSVEALLALRGVISGQFDIAAPKSIETMERMRIWYPGLLESLMPIRKSNLALPDDVLIRLPDDVRVPGGLPDDVRNVVQMLVEKYNAQTSMYSETPAAMYGPIGENELGYFPCWPVVRGRAKYAMPRVEKEESDTCVKHRSGHPILGPGVVLYVCPHRICYGFTVMEACESPRMPFEVFVSRFIPKNVVYDNACKLHIYCLNREPFLFKDTRFFVDRFHWFGHTACSIAYDLNRYKSDNTVSSLNSQVNEQINSLLLKLKKPLSYMNFKNFMCNLKLYLYLRNVNTCANF